MAACTYAGTPRGPPNLLQDYWTVAISAIDPRLRKHRTQSGQAVDDARWLSCTGNNTSEAEVVQCVATHPY